MNQLDESILERIIEMKGRNTFPAARPRRTMPSLRPDTWDVAPLLDARIFMLANGDRQAALAAVLAAAAAAAAGPPPRAAAAARQFANNH